MEEKLKFAISLAKKAGKILLKHQKNFKRLKTFENNEIVLGVVYQPTTDKCFYASKNKGSYCNKKKINSSSVDSLVDSIIILGVEYTNIASVAEMKRLFSILSPRVSYRIKISESAALNLCYVASGINEIYIHPTEKMHDMAAGVLIAKEAGCAAINYSFPEEIRGPESWNFRKKGVIVSGNKKLLAEVIRKI